MSLRWFICPDGRQIECAECIKHNGCRMGNRCKALPVLMQMNDTRRYDPTKLLTGEQIPSTTQLLNGTQYSFLEVTNDYALKPSQLVWATYGTGIHSGLDGNLGENSFGSLDLQGLRSSVGVAGLPDFYVSENGKHCLWDYKSTTPFKVQKWLEGDRFDWTYQVNHYRVELKEKGYQIDRLYIQTFMKGYSPKMNRSVAKLLAVAGYDPEDSAPVLEVDVVSDAEIKKYFTEKKAELMAALKDNEWGKPCSDHERWGGRKCKGYCSVSHLCQFARGGENGVITDTGD